jgi:hypothetical protein
MKDAKLISHWYTLKSPAHVACGIISNNGSLSIDHVNCKNCLRTKRAKQILEIIDNEEKRHEQIHS